MYLNPYQAGKCLTIAYSIMKTRPGTDFGQSAIDKPVGRSSVVYDETNTFILKTPKERLSSKSSHSGRRNNNNALMNFTEAGQLIAAAENRTEGHKHWARFCYNPDHDSEWVLSAKWISKSLFCAWCYINKRPTRISRERFEDLAMICALDRVNIAANGSGLYTADEVCKHLGYKDKKSAHWGSRLRPHWELMRDILDRHNDQTLGPVGIRIKSLMREADDLEEYDIVQSFV